MTEETPNVKTMYICGLDSVLGTARHQLDTKRINPSEVALIHWSNVPHIQVDRRGFDTLQNDPWCIYEITVAAEQAAQFYGFRSNHNYRDFRLDVLTVNEYRLTSIEPLKGCFMDFIEYAIVQNITAAIPGYAKKVSRLVLNSLRNDIPIPEAVENRLGRHFDEIIHNRLWPFHLSSQSNSSHAHTYAGSAMQRLLKLSRLLQWIREPEEAAKLENREETFLNTNPDSLTVPFAFT